MLNNMRKNLSLVVVVVALTSAVAMAQSQASAVRSLTGTVTCEGRVTHLYTCQRNQTQQTCTLACVQRGSRFVLMVGDKFYPLEGDSRELETYAGGKATVTGTALGDRIEVQTASNAKYEMPGQPLPPSMGANTSNSQWQTESPQTTQPDAK
jgi:hypothetical protein